MNNQIYNSERNEYLHQKNLTIIISILFIVSFIFYKFGYFMGSSNFIPKDETVRSNVSTYLTGLITLLGLLMAFTFSMASERYQERKHLMVEESNEIGTAFYYTSLLTTYVGENIRNLLKEYIELRIRYDNIRHDITKTINIKEETELLQLKMWNIVASEARENPNPIFVPIVTNMNNLTDVAEKRNDAMDNHVPEPIIWLLLILSVLNMAAMGFGAGMVGHENFIYVQILNLAICTTLYIIIDLDRPTKGIIKVSQSSLLELRKSFYR